MADMTQMTSREHQRMNKAKKFLRLFLMDQPELNRLVRGYETDPERLELAILLTIDDWNITTPMLTPVSIGNYPSLFLLLHGAAIQCLKMAGLYQSRNELNYNAGGSSFIRANKTPYYQSWIQNFSSEYESKKVNMKMQQNIEAAYGEGFGSEYGILGFDW